jgi:hypothetical protein
VSEDAAHIASFNPFVALELIRLARLGKWAEEVGVEALKYYYAKEQPVVLQSGVTYQPVGKAGLALSRLPKVTVEVLDE